MNYRSDAFRFTGDLPPGLRRKDNDPFTFIHDQDGSEMAWIPAGLFISGSDNPDEKPIRIRRLERGGFLDKFLVTNGQYARFLNAAGKFDADWIDLDGEYKNEKCRILRRKNEFTVETVYDRYPVNFVTVAGAEAYADWAGKALPSEWLWEKAGRGLDGRTYPWGDEWDWDKCNSGEFWAQKDLSDSSVWNAWDDSPDRRNAKITPVDQFFLFISPLGCADLSGNLWEWMREPWKDVPDRRVVRGGGSDLYRDDVRLANRGSLRITDRYVSRGFRLSRTV